jgi:hypothetical protein
VNNEHCVVSFPVSNGGMDIVGISWKTLFVLFYPVQVSIRLIPWFSLIWLKILIVIFNSRLWTQGILWYQRIKVIIASHNQKIHLGAFSDSMNCVIMFLYVPLSLCTFLSKGREGSGGLGEGRRKGNGLKTCCECSKKPTAAHWGKIEFEWSFIVLRWKIYPFSIISSLIIWNSWNALLGRPTFQIIFKVAQTFNVPPVPPGFLIWYYETYP